ncbi:MAG: DeoR/GlpR family DNA-binding transcription regulator [Firmicutes bacterium]|nr:DeoR/GlpR family DNA-binding transcription regulator [Bacillota bacterium]
MARRARAGRADARRRHMAIVDLLDRQGALSVAALAHEFQCSPATIRRDLEALSREGVPLQHHHGSVSLVRTDLATQWEAGRIAEYAAKEAIAQLVVEAIPPATTVGLNGGTTTLLIARALVKAGKPVRVVTNALNIAYELAVKGMDVVMVGGAVRLPNFESTGPLALATLTDMHVDWGILGAEGADPVFGFSTTSEDEAAVAQAFRACSDHIVMAVDHTKLGKKAIFRLLPWAEANYLVSNLGVAVRLAWLGEPRHQGHGAGWWVLHE